MTDDETQAFWVTAPGRGEIRSQPLPPAEPGRVTVRTLFTGISRGTECLVFSGAVPESQWQAMRAPFQEGDFPAPVKYGYVNVGVVEDGPAALAGRAVFCLYPHQTRYRVPTGAVMPLPDRVPPGRAVLAANMETAVNGLWDAAPRVGDRIAVVGAGVVGCLTAYLATRLPGAAVQLIDVDPGKAAVAARLGVAFATPDKAIGEADLVIHASGAPDGLGLALSLAGFEATVLELSWFGTKPVTLPLGEDFHARRLTIRSSQVGTVAAAQRARWDHRRRAALALNLLADPALDTLIDGEVAFADLPVALVRLCQEPAGALCRRVLYR